MRTALLYVPRHMWRRGALPLVLVFHGGASTPEAIAEMSAMHRVAEREGFIVAYPAGTQGRSGLTWSPGGTRGARQTRDARFVSHMMLDLRQRYEIDRTRIFAAGFSIGGALVYELACLLSDQIAAVAVVAGTMTIADCTPTRPVSLIHIHGTDDRRVPVSGGRGSATSGNNKWRPVQDCIDRWCDINGCKGKPHVARHAIDGVTVSRYVGTSDVELWLVEGGGHAWPGGRRYGDRARKKPEPLSGFSATEKIWSFFADHPRGRHFRHLPAVAGDGPDPA
jgi:polyhydroxybutyrate depolymerase